MRSWLSATGRELRKLHLQQQRQQFWQASAGPNTSALPGCLLLLAINSHSACMHDAGLHGIGHCMVTEGCRSVPPPSCCHRLAAWAPGAVQWSWSMHGRQQQSSATSSCSRRHSKTPVSSVRQSPGGQGQRGSSQQLCCQRGGVMRSTSKHSSGSRGVAAAVAVIECDAGQAQCRNSSSRSNSANLGLHGVSSVVCAVAR